MQQFPDSIILNILTKLDFISYLKFIRTCKKVYSQSKYIINEILKKEKFQEIKVSKTKNGKFKLSYDPEMFFDMRLYPKAIEKYIDAFIKKHDLYLDLKDQIYAHPSDEYYVYDSPLSSHFLFSIILDEKIDKKNYVNSLYLVQYIYRKMIFNEYYFEDKKNYNCLNLIFKNEKIKYYYFDVRTAGSIYIDEKPDKYFIPTKGSKLHQLTPGEHKIGKLQIFVSIIMGKKCFSCGNCNADYNVLKYIKNNPPIIL